MANFMSTELPDIPRIYTALAEFAAAMVFVFCYRRRFTSIAKNILLSLAFVAVFIAYQLLAGILPLYLWVPGMIGAFLLITLQIFALCRLRFTDALYFAIRAFILAEFAASLEWQLWCFFHLQGLLPQTLEAPFLVLTYGAVYLLLGFIEWRFSGSGTPEIHQRELFSALVIGIITFVLSNISFLNIITPVSVQGTEQIFILRTFVDIGGLAVLYAYHVQINAYRARLELATMENLLQQQYSQYKLFQANLDAINFKYHDLKNLLAVMRAEDDAEKQQAYYDDLEESLSIYASRHNTGNKALDTVLNTKAIQCEKQHIDFTVMAGGAVLDFMDDMDICSIIGNALDNAIEHEMLIEDAKKRMVTLLVQEKNGFLLIKTSNCLKSEFQGGQTPPTSKGDRQRHGFGLKSIRYSAARYGGTVSIDTDKAWFHLLVLIPR
jgi:hypothetical protein